MIRVRKLTFVYPRKGGGQINKVYRLLEIIRATTGPNFSGRGEQKY